MTIGLSGEAWAGLYLSEETIKELVAAGKAEVRQGSVEEAAALFELFDKYRPEKAVLVTPHLHD